MTDRVRRCIFCLHDVRQTVRESVVTAACDGCGAIFQIVFNPPGAPWLRGEIDVIVEPRVDVQAEPSEDEPGLYFDCVELATEDTNEK